MGKNMSGQIRAMGAQAYHAPTRCRMASTPKAGELNPHCAVFLPQRTSVLVLEALGIRDRCNLPSRRNGENSC